MQECYLFTLDARDVKTFHNEVNTVGGFPYCGDSCFEYGIRISSHLNVKNIVTVGSAEDCQACKISGWNGGTANNEHLSFQMLQIECQNDDLCEFWTFSAKTHECGTKFAGSPTYNSGHGISGPKYCPSSRSKCTRLAIT